MAAPTNTTPATAVVIPALPYSVTQQVDDAGTAYAVYYQYTAQPGDFYIGVFGQGIPFNVDGTTGYQPLIDVYRPDGTTLYATNLFGFFGHKNLPVQLQLVVGETYWFKFTPLDATHIPAILDLSVVAHVEQAVPIGSILVTDDSYFVLPGGGIQEIPAAALSAVNGDNYNVLRFVGNSGLTAGEYLDVLNDGTYAIAVLNTGFNIYTNQFALSVFCPCPFTSGSASADFIVRAARGVEKFYIAARDNAAAQLKVVEFSKTGVQGTTWLLGNTAALGGAVNAAGTIFYYVDNAGLKVKAWDLVGNVSLGIICDPVSVLGLFPGRMHCLADDTIIMYADFHSTFADKVVLRYSPAGVLLNSYTFDGSIYSRQDPRIAIAVDDPLSFWVFFKGQTPRTPWVMYFLNVRISDGVVISTVLHVSYELGGWNSNITSTPISRFGPSESCDFGIMRAPLGPVTPTTGDLTVTKDVVPSDATVFDFTTGGGLVPGTFSLADGGSQAFLGLAPGSGYSVAETVNPSYTTTVIVSNGSPINNLSVSAGESVVVAFTNTLIVIPGRPGCPLGVPASVTGRDGCASWSLP